MKRRALGLTAVLGTACIATAASMSTTTARADVADLSMTTLTKPGAYRLINDNTWATALTDFDGVGVRVTYDQVLSDHGRKTNDVGKPVENFDPTDAGQTWHGLESTASIRPSNRWEPQGVAMGQGSAAHDLIVSWYDVYHARHPEEPDEGSSVTLVDTAGQGYRRVLLVRAHGAQQFLPVDAHAGGIARAGRLLYVADKDFGLRVFNLKQMRKVWTGSDGYCDTRIGRHLIDGKTHYCAYGLRYVLPQVDTYHLPQSGPLCGPDGAWRCFPDGETPLLRFSTLTLDMTSSPPHLVMAEFCNGQDGGADSDWRCPYDPQSRTAGRVVGWQLGPDDKLVTDGILAVADRAYVANVQGIQGLATGVDGPGTYLFSQGSGRLQRIGTSSDYPPRVWRYDVTRQFVHADEGIVVDHSDPSNPWLWVATENSNEYADGDGIYVGRGIFADDYSRYSASATD